MEPCLHSPWPDVSSSPGPLSRSDHPPPPDLVSIALTVPQLSPSLCGSFPASFLSLPFPSALKDPSQTLPARILCPL